jgi:hypothetical protein
VGAAGGGTGDAGLLGPVTITSGTSTATLTHNLALTAPYTLPGLTCSRVDGSDTIQVIPANFTGSTANALAINLSANAASDVQCVAAVGAVGAAGADANVTTFAGTPPGTCTVGDIGIDTTFWYFYTCPFTNTWQKQAKLLSGAGAPDSAACNSVEEAGNWYADTTATTFATSLYACGASGAGPTYAWSQIPSGGGHTQNTDTGTTATCFQLDNDASGPKLCHDASSGYQVKTSADVVLMTLDSSGVLTLGDGTAPWNLTGITDDVAPSAPGSANQFTSYVDRTSGLLAWILNGGSAQYVASGNSSGAATLAPTEAYDATGWNSDTAPPQKDAVRDKIETLAPLVSPSFTTPSLGVASATSINKVALTAPATASTLTIADGKTLTASNTLTLTGTDSSSVAFGTGGTVAYTIYSGTKALDTDAIASTACDTMTQAATGVASTDIVSWTFNADVTAVTGYAPVTAGGLSIYIWPTTNTINIKTCNPTSSSITPGAVSINLRVTR